MEGVLIIVKNVKSKILFLFCFLLIGCTKTNKMIDLSNKSIDEIKEYAIKNELNLEIDYEFSDIEKDKIISQSIEVDSNINKNDNLKIIISKGIDYDTLYKENKVNELGNIPIMMYHGIVNKLDEDTPYTGGNVDKDGYHRTTESFIKDLEFYYSEGYRMIRLEDYVKGVIDVPLGKSPIVLTFDDGLENSIKVTGVDDNGIIIDPNCAVGILESFKKKYPDYNVTATFFVNGTLFRQPKYNEQILNWLVDNGYDIGNHSYNHADFTKISESKSEEEIGKLYNLLDKYIKDKYINIVALPFGSPYKKSHNNFKHIINSSYENVVYNTISTLQVGWEANYSPFSSNFDESFIKRIRAYDNDGTNFDITHNFNRLKNNKYISDGDKNKIVVPAGSEVNNKFNLEVIYY
mgnify:CR=1 FL=1